MKKQENKNVISIDITELEIKFLEYLYIKWGKGRACVRFGFVPKMFCWLGINNLKKNVLIVHLWDYVAISIKWIDFIEDGSYKKSCCRS